MLLSPLEITNPTGRIVISAISEIDKTVIYKPHPVNTVNIHIYDVNDEGQPVQSLQLLPGDHIPQLIEAFRGWRQKRKRNKADFPVVAEGISALGFHEVEGNQIVLTFANSTTGATSVTLNGAEVDQICDYLERLEKPPA